ncbi:hypothetical protein THAOC_20699 [Thalassiosira oceanica]|uniref:Uncharacterized protein n=1 Tax=Thalassiosira oceanica TaxID=159749 RepID=K0SKZ8_THAOC|nr:hypothetical protein THAOC_20699 [Thalassiosira oceanica]|eukprot:EJK59122.1 hypothetical protein THAOC_20699 [Thalassiosira oceanica]
MVRDNPADVHGPGRRTPRGGGGWCTLSPRTPALVNLTTNSPAKSHEITRPRVHSCPSSSSSCCSSSSRYLSAFSPPEDAASAGENSPGVAAAIQLGAPRGSALQQSPRDDDDHYGEDDVSLGLLGSNLEFAASAQPASASDPDGDTHGGDAPGPEGRVPGEDTPETESDAPGGDTPETEGDTPGTGGDTLKLKAARLDLEPGGPTGRRG